MRKAPHMAAGACVVEWSVVEFDVWMLELGEIMIMIIIIVIIVRLVHLGSGGFFRHGNLWIPALEFDDNLCSVGKKRFVILWNLLGRAGAR